MAFDCWTKIIIESLKDRLVKLLLEQIHLFVEIKIFLMFTEGFLLFSDRLGECVNQTTIKSVIMSFVDVYQNRKVNVLEVKKKIE